MSLKKKDVCDSKGNKDTRNTRLEKVITDFERGMFGMVGAPVGDFKVMIIFFFLMSSENKGAHCMVFLYMLHIFYDYYLHLAYLGKQTKLSYKG